MLFLRRSWCILALLVAPACAGGDDPAARSPTAETHATASTEVLLSEEPTPEPGRAERFTVAEAVGDRIVVYEEPNADEPKLVLDRADEISGKLVFLAVGTPDPDSSRVEVHLPVRPNGSTGWVARDDVAMSAHTFRVEVRIAEHRLIAHEGDEVVLDTKIAVGTNDTPTPGGVFFIKELLEPPSPDGPYGTYAYGLSGFSMVLEEFGGGNGVIGIHGTNDPSKIGTDVSHGCIRLTNADIEVLVEQVGLPLGTPVEILP